MIRSISTRLLSSQALTSADENDPCNAAVANLEAFADLLVKVAEPILDHLPLRLSPDTKDTRTYMAMLERATIQQQGHLTDDQRERLQQLTSQEQDLLEREL